MNIEPWDLVSTSEISRLSGHQIGTIHHWMRRYPDFPVPFVTLSQGTKTPIRVWYRPDIEAWLKKTGRMKDLSELVK